MIEKGNTPPKLVDLLLDRLPARSGSDPVRHAAKEYLVQGGNQPDIAERYGVKQASLSRLVSKLGRLHEWALEVAKYSD